MNERVNEGNTFTLNAQIRIKFDTLPVLLFPLQCEFRLDIFIYFSVPNVAKGIGREQKWKTCFFTFDSVQLQRYILFIAFSWIKYLQHTVLLVYKLIAKFLLFQRLHCFFDLDFMFAIFIFSGTVVISRGSNFGTFAFMTPS